MKRRSQGMPHFPRYTFELYGTASKMTVLETDQTSNLPSYFVGVWGFKSQNLPRCFVLHPGSSLLLIAIQHWQKFLGWGRKSVKRRITIKLLLPMICAQFGSSPIIFRKTRLSANWRCPPHCISLFLWCGCVYIWMFPVSTVAQLFVVLIPPCLYSNSPPVPFQFLPLIDPITLLYLNLYQLQYIQWFLSHSQEIRTYLT